jgi:hypothetical protein
MTDKFKVRKDNFKTGVSLETQVRARHQHSDANRKSKREQSFLTKRLRSSNVALIIPTVSIDIILSSIYQVNINSVTSLRTSLFMVCVKVR